MHERLFTRIQFGPSTLHSFPLLSVLQIYSLWSLLNGTCHTQTPQRDHLLCFPDVIAMSSRSSLSGFEPPEPLLDVGAGKKAGKKTDRRVIRSRAEVPLEALGPIVTHSPWLRGCGQWRKAGFSLSCNTTAGLVIGMPARMQARALNSCLHGSTSVDLNASSKAGSAPPRSKVTVRHQWRSRWH